MYRSYSELKSNLSTNKISVLQVVAHYVSQIEKNKHLNAFLEVFEDDALNRAREIDKKISQNKAGKLAGMVIGIKDNLCYKGHKVSAASKILEGFESLYTATAVQRLLDEDAIIIGRLNCDEFAMGSSNENSAFGKVLNPINNKLVPGGSSGGSAAAVKAGLCMAALGSDTGGSIRQPASFCDIVGLKPSYGRISRYGLIAYASSFDQIGPLTNTIEDAALILQIMAGKDEMDSTSSSKPIDDYLSFEKKKNKIAIFSSFISHSGIDHEVKNGINSILSKLEAQGHEVEAVDFPYLDYLVPTYYVLTTAEASSNLARYDGIHYGYRSENTVDMETTYKKSRTEGFGEEVKRRIMLGTFVLSSGYYDAYYSKAQKVRRLLKNTMDELFEKFDHIVIPTSPHTPFQIGQQVDDPIKMYLEDIFTVLANLSGNPAISLPVGKHSSGLPFGLQIISKNFCEREMLSFSKEIMDNFSRN